MRSNVPGILVTAILLTRGSAGVLAQEVPYGKGMTDANKERLVIDDMEDVADWYCGSPVESKVSTSDQHVEQGKLAMKFANVVDHTKGEKNYPIGWPRTGKDLVKAKLTDWSAYDFFECRIYVDTNRESLPGTPLGIGFYHSGHRRTSSFTLKEIRKDAWVKIVIPTAKLIDARDVRRVQFHISESNYKHGDRVDFYVDDMVLTRFVDPTVAELGVDRKILYANDRRIIAIYKLMGHKNLDDVTVEFAIGQGTGEPAATTTGKPNPQGELPLKINKRLAPGIYWARLGLRDAQGKLIDRKQTEFRVIDGPF